VDFAGFDPDTHLIFFSCGDGTLSIYHEKSADVYEDAGAVKTQPSAKTMAFDPKTKKIFLPAAEILEGPPAQPGGRLRAHRSQEHLWFWLSENHKAKRRARKRSKSLNAIQFSGRVSEQHQVDFSFDQFIGNLEIRVDGQPVVKDFRMLSLSLTKRYEFTVGQAEQHHVAIEKKENYFSPAFGPCNIASSSTVNWCRLMKVNNLRSYESYVQGHESIFRFLGK